ncbi:hypothetical protein RI129_011056 [Pyrocoelia pectoralis]|uniref:Uncharacterized protein n=1 Tax=Pyrocoelia pectoralis TaxID=417401 RepID=A0AAN7V092_9COLE
MVHLPSLLLSGRLICLPTLRHSLLIGFSEFKRKIRIHVPTKIKTIYKIIKVPQHHHYFHEKVKEVPKFVPIAKDHHDSGLLGDSF